MAYNVRYAKWSQQMQRIERLLRIERALIALSSPPFNKHDKLLIALYTRLA
jgi:hypothetical protein